MYSMVMMMAMSGTPDAAAFGGKLFGGRSSCHGTTMTSCHGSTACYGSGYHAAPTVPAPSYGCSGYTTGYSSCYGSTGCHGAAKKGFLGMGLCDHFKGMMSRSSSCHGCTGYTTSAYSGCTGYTTPAYSGCTGHTAGYTTSYTGCTGYTPAANCCPAPAVSTGCTGGVISGYSSMPGTAMPGTVITESPAMPAAPEMKDMPKPDAKEVVPGTPATPAAPMVEKKKGEGV